jgi:hypothetical protein
VKWEASLGETPCCGVVYLFVTFLLKIRMLAAQIDYALSLTAVKESSMNFKKMKDPAPRVSLRRNLLRKEGYPISSKVKSFTPQAAGN